MLVINKLEQPHHCCTCLSTRCTEEFTAASLNSLPSLPSDNTGNTLVSNRNLDNARFDMRRILISLFDSVDILLRSFDPFA